MKRSATDLFPSKKLTAQEVFDLYRSGVVLTIKSVEVRFSEQDQQDYGVLYFVESRKPISLNKTNAMQISDLAGTDEFDAWEGVLVKLFATPVEIPDSSRPGFKKQVLGLRVFPPKQGELPPPDLRPNTDWTVLHREARQLAQRHAGGAAAAQIAAKPIGMEAAIKIVVELDKRGKNVDFAVAHLQARSFGPSIIGKTPPEWPETVLEPLRTLVRGFAATVKVDEQARSEELRALWTPPPAPPEVINPKTGEVLSGNRPSKADEINPDDIPF